MFEKTLELNKLFYYVLGGTRKHSLCNSDSQRPKGGAIVETITTSLNPMVSACVLN